jgi:IclR family transcriptional regulator, KDG regulon repressor
MTTRPSSKAATAPVTRRSADAAVTEDLAQPTDDAEPVGRSTTTDLLKLIEELATFDRIGVTRLGRHLGIPAPTAYRMLRALERAGYVEQLDGSKEYRLTLKLFELGCQVASRTTMRDVAAVEIERLADQTGLAANVGIMIDEDVLYLGKVETDDLLTLNLRPGSRAPVTCTAMGKAMLAVESRPLRSIVGDGPYPARTEYSITTYEDLVADLAEAQRHGYAVDRQELSLGVWCVAAPILGTRQAQNGAVSVTSYGAALDDADCERLGKLVVACAARVARRIGDLGDFQSWARPRASYPRP